MAKNSRSAGRPQDFSHLGPCPSYLIDGKTRPLLGAATKQQNDEDNALDVSCAEVAAYFWGEPTSTTSKEFRWGTHGSRCVNLERNVWYDHEVKDGGDTIALVERELRLSRAVAISWLLDGRNYSGAAGLNNLNGQQRPDPLGRVAATYDYINESGALLFQVLRFDPKTFRQRRPDGGGGWVWSVDGVRRVPYRLAELLNDVAKRHTIVIVEGERDVDNLRRSGIPATTNAGGAGKWTPEHSRYLRNADVVLIPDNDDAGRDHMNKVGLALMNTADSVRILQLPNLQEKGDVSDWFAAGHIAEELAILISQAPQWQLRAPFATNAHQESETGMGGSAKPSESKHGSSQTAADADSTARDVTQREKLVLIGLDADLWHDKDSNAFARVTVSQHQENFAMKSTAFRGWLTHQYGERYPMKIAGRACPSAPSTQALSEAINALSAKAARGTEHQAAVRVGGHGGLIYLDLGTPEWGAVEIAPEGWRIIDVAPVRFIRPPGFRALPVPVKGGKISELGRFLNVTSRNDFILVVSWLLAALRPTGPYPILVINGEQGAGKTLACPVLRRLIDPNGAELRTDTRDERDLLLAARNSWVVALDNLSYVRNDLSDAICRIATKGAFATRALYTNDEEFFLEVCRPVLLKGIPPLASRADLADRAIVWVLPTMPDDKRRSEEEFWVDFEGAAPRILGALLDGASGALRLRPSIQLKHSCRMMDFAKWAEASCQALGLPPGLFEDAYSHNRSSASEDALDADPVATAVIDFMSDKLEFVGTATELLSKLEALISPSQRDRRWPKDATRLSSHLRRLPPLLRPRGIEIDFGKRSADAARKRHLVIKKVGPK
jgi:putative DNA primase/helicase